jgi:hypothetical protein
MNAYPEVTVDEIIDRMTLTGAQVTDSRNGRTKPRIDLVGAVNLSFSISGRVITPKGAPMEGVTMTLSGDASSTTATNANGNYVFSDLQSGSYTITPSKDNITFKPASKDITVDGASVAGKNFTANVYSVSGRIRTASGAAVSGVTVTMSGVASGTTLTDDTGKYIFREVPNGMVTLMPSKAGYAFSPVSKTFTVSGADVTGKKFTAITYSISGYVRTPSGAPMTGVTMTLSGSVIKTKTTDSNGFYRFANLPIGIYTVTPNKGALSFVPVSSDVIINDANEKKVNFWRNF